ncbi:MAG TPA: class I SAM-dependent methyltransferase [Pararhizobium sp.]|uniref:class I SAM-dependent methyltransferase n=1 Tax=Pararhizobium sp. TaxID=1977563 RepID=UPI002B60CC1E|nr:class I SAM-dependent methyltransferase [Pararhizobium sp.]HTO32886.1 class I SAM-dependent methyltransferase [Pararhizobium sp.]
MTEQTQFDDAAFAEWLKKNPGGEYSLFSARKTAAGISKGRPHPTLGPRLQVDSDWWEAGKPIVNELLEFHRISETATVCDYGCGSLRIGAHFLKRQPKGCFFGLDVTEDFISYGRELIGADLLEEKRPTIGSIKSTLDKVIAAQCDVLYSTHVAIHVHPDEKTTYLNNLKEICHKPGSTIIFDALISKDRVRFRNSGWGWPIKFYVEAMAPFVLSGLSYRRPRENVGHEYFFAFERPL